MVQHGTYRPERAGVQVFQTHPSGWHFAEGHVAKLELLGRDFPYTQPSKGTFSITAEDVLLELPVREHPDGARIERYAPAELELALSAKRRQRVLSGKALRVRVACPRTDCSVHAVASARVSRAARKRRAVSASVSLRAAEGATLEVRLDKKLRHALGAARSRGGKPHASIAVTATDDAGNSVTRRVRVRIVG
jgi:hypothetical protein